MTLSLHPARTIGAVWVIALLVSVRGFSVELDIPVFSGGFGVAFYEETAREFETLRPGVKVKLYGDPRIQDKLRVRMIDGDLPDAAFPRDLLIPALARAGKLRDLTPFLDGPNWEGDARWRDTFLPGALDGWRIDGGTYGLPLGYACWSIFYNQALFQSHGWRVPQTWDEFFVLCEQIKATGLAPVSLTGVYGQYPDAFLRSAYYNLAGPEAWTALNELAPGARLDPRYERAAEVLQRITQRYTLSGWEGATHTAAQVAFLEGRAAMTVSGSWMVNEMAGKIPAGFEIGVMNFPVFTDGVADPTSIQASADNFFVFATGDPVREKLTLDFLRFLTSRSRAAAFVRRMDAPVAVRGVPLEAFSPRMRETATLISGARAAFSMPQVMMQPPTTRQVLIDARLDLMTGANTPHQFAARLEAAAATDRARAISPGVVEYRHPYAGTMLLLALGGFAAWLLWKKVGRVIPNPPPQSADGTEWRVKDNAPYRAENYFGRLRGSVALSFIAPAFFLYAGLVLAPAVMAVAWAFMRWDGLGPSEWAGWFNFKWLIFESDIFWQALKNNFFLMLVPTFVVLPLALLFAYLLHRGIWGSKMFRAVFLFPNLLGGIAATLLWMNA